MGCLKPCFSTNGGSVEYAVIQTYDEITARATSPGFDDTLGEPFLPDDDEDGIGERTRPGTEYRLRCKATWTRGDEQTQDQVGNAPTSSLTITLYEADLEAEGLLVDGVLEIRPNDLLLRLEKPNGTIRWDFARGGHLGMYCFEVRPGETGTGLFYVLFERRRPVSR